MPRPMAAPRHRNDILIAALLHQRIVPMTHHQAVAQVASPLKVTAVSGDGIVEGLELKEGAVEGPAFLLTVQFHPERLADRYQAHQAIFNAFAKACARNGKNNYEG